MKNNFPGRKFIGHFAKKRRGSEAGKFSRALETGALGRWILGVMIFLLSVLIISWRGTPLILPVKGQISEKDIEALYAFSFPDQLKTEQAREVAADSQPLAYALDRSIPEEKVTVIDEFFGSLSAGGNDPSAPFAISLVRPQRIIKNLSRFFLPPILEERLKTAVEKSYRNGILSADTRKTLRNTRQKELQLSSRQMNHDRLVSLEAIPVPEEARRDLSGVVSELYPDGFITPARFSELFDYLIEANLTFAPEKTESLRQDARKKIEPIMTRVEKGQKIIRQGEEVRPVHIQKLRSYQKELYLRQPPISRIYYLIGISVLVLLMFALTIYYLENYHRDLSRSNSRLLMISANVIMVLLLARFVRYLSFNLPPATTEITRFICPVTVGSLLLCLLVGVRVAVFLTLIVGFQTALIVGGGSGYLLSGITSALVGVFSLKGARRRIDLIRAGFYAAAAGFIIVVALGITGGYRPAVFLSQGVGALTGGISGAFIALIALGLLETVFRVSSDIGLVELADLNHPLLRKLMIRAPGTYHHSLMVATLAERAAQVINANPLLARNGGYFHDIGKLVKPEYFSENETSDYSHHDRLIPSMSSLVLISHVKEGVALARKHKLDKRVISIIQQHHGTGVIAYFYDRAERSRQMKFSVLEKDYRYPGPKPQSREAAIVMLADATEAASVSLERPTAVRLETLVRGIIQERFSDGQLDECDLTLIDLKKISDSFIRHLAARYHTRVKYPEGKKVPSPSELI